MFAYSFSVGRVIRISVSAINVQVHGRVIRSAGEPNDYQF